MLSRKKKESIEKDLKTWINLTGIAVGCSFEQKDSYVNDIIAIIEKHVN